MESWKLNTIEERRHDQSCLFLLEDYRKSDHKPETFLGSNPGEDDFCYSESKHDRRKTHRTLCFGEKIRNKLEIFPGLESLRIIIFLIVCIESSGP